MRAPMGAASAEVAREGCQNAMVQMGTCTKALEAQPEVNQGNSSAKWVPIGVLEKGYGHRFGL